MKFNNELAQKLTEWCFILVASEDTELETDDHFKTQGMLHKYTK